MSFDEAHVFEPHHGRRIWLDRKSPAGVFAPDGSLASPQRPAEHPPVANTPSRAAGRRPGETGEFSGWSLPAAASTKRMGD